MGMYNKITPVCSRMNISMNLGYWEMVIIAIFLLIQPNKIQAQINVVDNSLGQNEIDPYSFLVGGHYYGNSSNTTGLPANTVLANLDFINADLFGFHIALGDVFLDVRNDFPLYKKKFFDKIKCPFYIAVGNHDISGSFFEDEIGKTSLQFTFGSDVHVILDTEKNDGSIIGDQLALLERTCNSDCDNIFIYSHRPVWSEEDPEMKGLFKDNTTSTFGLNYKEDVLPLIQSVNDSVNVFWMSGSLGGSAPASYFYHRRGNIHFIQTAVRGIKRDGVLQVAVDNGAVSFKPVSLTGQNLMSLESYDLAFWRSEHPKEEFNPRLIKLYLINMVSHRYFWYGIIFALLSISIFGIMRRRTKMKNGS